MRNRKSIGDIIRLTRESQGLSRGDLSLICRRRGSPVHVNTIFRLETASSRRVRIWTVQALCHALGLPFGDTVKRIAR